MRSSNKCLWILEDDPGSRFVYEETLAIRYDLKFLGTIDELRNALLNSSPEDIPDLVIADLRLPDGNFLRFLTNDEARRKLTCQFVVVSSIDDLDVLRNCYGEGALDYLTKPFRKGELIVKIERIFRSAEEKSRPVIASGDVRFDPITMKVHRGSNDFAQLTAKELQIFALLHQNKNRALRKGEIVAQIWGNIRVGSKTLDVHLFNLRNKLATVGLEIEYTPPDCYELKSLAIQGMG